MWLALTAVAWPCAGIVHSTEEYAESDAAEVVFEAGDGAIAVSYDVTYVGDAADFGWVIPVGGEVVAVEDGDPHLFTRLREATQPSVTSTVDVADGGGCGCGPAAKSGGDNSYPTTGDGLTVIAEGFTGTYDYVVIAATEVTALSTWFDDNGWAGIEPADLAHYVDLGAPFVALHVTPQVATTPSEGRGLPPVRISYAGDALRFPSVMARHAAVPTQRTTAYVVGDSRARVEAGWEGVDPPEIVYGDEGTDAVEAFLAHLAPLGEARTWHRTTARPVEDRFVTRFDLFAPTEVHDADAVFAFESSTNEIRTRITPDFGPPPEGAAVPWVLCVGLAGWRRRGRRVSRAGTTSRR